MNNLTTIISEMIENELPSLNMDASNHVLDRLSNKIINEVRNSICEALLSDEMVQIACVANNMNFPTMICINGMEAALTAVAEKIRGSDA